MESPNNPLGFPNVVMGSYWGGFHFLDPLGGLGCSRFTNLLAILMACGLDHAV